MKKKLIRSVLAVSTLVILLLTILPLTACANKTGGANKTGSEKSVKTFDEISRIHSKKKYARAEKTLTADYLLGKWSAELDSDLWVWRNIIFDADGTYYIDGSSKHYVERGSYVLDGNRVVLSLPVQGERHWGDEIFAGESEITLTYDYDFKDFYNVGVLRNERLILRNGVEETACGTECFVKGVEVVKAEPSAVVITENVEICREPSFDGAKAAFWYPEYLNRTLGEVLEKTYYVADEQKEIPCSVFLSGTVASCNARTVRQDTAGGVTAPWYRISLVSDGGPAENFWVFGGFVEQYDEKKKPEYMQQLFDSAMQKELFKVDEDSYTQFMLEESHKKVAGLAWNSVEKILKAGGAAYHDEFLDGTVFKIGMTKKEVIDLLGNPPQVRNEESGSWDWNMLRSDSREIERGLQSNEFCYYCPDSNGSDGYNIFIAFTDGKLSGVEVKLEK